jgi:predicted GIY-YIG superfamily endonuclease
MVVYLLHFDRPYQHARHYLGSCTDLTRRLAQHGKGRGARLLEVVQAVGIGWQLARTWGGGTHRERQRTNQGGASRLCPLCKEARRAAHHEIS